MNEHSVNEFLAFFFRDARASRVRLLRIAEHLERQFPYTVCDSWLSPRGHVGLLNLSTAAHSGALDGSESIGSKTSVLPANRVRECPSFAWLRAGPTPAVWRVIENPRAAQLEATGVPRTPLSQYLWICFQASLLHSSV